VNGQGNQALRRLLLAVLALGLAGTAIELVLLEHDESLLQLLPLVLIAIGLAVIACHVFMKSRLTVHLMRITMAAFVAAGVLGMVLHYQGNVEFQKELDPSLAGLSLFLKAIRSKAPPALAPGMLVQLGLLGLVVTSQGRDRRDKT
jgi:hypothetical protein